MRTFDVTYKRWDDTTKKFLTEEKRFSIPNVKFVDMFNKLISLVNDYFSENYYDTAWITEIHEVKE